MTIAMGFVLLLVMFGMIALFVVNWSDVWVAIRKKRKARHRVPELTAPQKSDLQKSPPTAPTGLGWRRVTDDHKALEKKLDAALDVDFMNKVKLKVLESHPEIGEAEYGWLLLELKRFFILCAIMKNADMYSPKTDILWHQMILFTKEYQQFCDRYLGEMIHHVPHFNAGTGGDNRQSRAIFELVYSHLFEVHEMNVLLIGNFICSIYTLNIKSREDIGQFFRRNPMDSEYAVIADVIAGIRQQTDDMGYSPPKSPSTTEYQDKHRASQYSKSSSVSRPSSSIRSGGSSSSSGSDDGGFVTGLLLGEALRSSCSSDSGSGSDSGGGGGSSCSSSSNDSSGGSSCSSGSSCGSSD